MEPAGMSASYIAFFQQFLSEQRVCYLSACTLASLCNEDKSIEMNDCRLERTEIILIK